MPLNVLLVCGGGFQGQSIAEAIRRQAGRRVIVFDSVADNLGRHFADRFVVAPPLADTARFVEKLHECIAAERVDLVLPCTHRELSVLAAHRDRLEQAGALLAVSSVDVVALVSDKPRLYAALAGAGIRVPEIVTGIDRPACALFGRPRDGWGARDTLRIEAGESLGARASVLERTHFFVRHLEHFDEFSVDFAIDAEGAISPVVIRRRARTSGGFAILSDSSERADLRELAGQACRWLADNGGCGVMNLQLIEDPRNGELVVSDVNARHGTSAGHAAAAGVDLAGFLVGRAGSLPERAIRSVRVLQTHAIPLAHAGAIDAVAFDLDDTLIDHKRWVLSKLMACDVVLPPQGDRHAFRLLCHRLVEEGPYDRLIDAMVAELGIDDRKGEVLEAFRRARPPSFAPFEDVLDVLAALKRARVRLAVITDNPPATQRAKLDAIPEVARLFDTVVFTQECGGEKPRVDGFIEASRRLGVAAGRMLMVGDNVGRDAVGAITAGYAGCCIVRRDGTRFNASPRLLEELDARCAERTWFAADLRDLPFACGVPA